MKTIWERIKDWLGFTVEEWREPSYWEEPLPALGAFAFAASGDSNPPGSGPPGEPPHSAAPPPGQEPSPEPEPPGDASSDPQPDAASSAEDGAAAPEPGDPPAPALAKEAKAARRAAKNKDRSPAARAMLSTGGSVAIVVAVLILLVAVIVGVQNNAATTMAQPQEIGVDDSMFGAQGYFLLHGFDDLTPDDINDLLTVSPTTGFYAREAADGAIKVSLQSHSAAQPYTVTLEHPVTGEIYVFEINKAPFTVSVSGNTSSLALDGSVTLQFSQLVTEEQVKRNVSFVNNCNIKINGKNVTLTPQSPLSYDSEYTLTVSGSMRSITGAQLHDAVSFRVHTAKNPFDFELVNAATELVPATEPLLLEFDMTNTLTGYAPVLIHIYRFPSLEKYGEQASILIEYDLDLDMLERTETILELMGNGTNEIEINLPEEGGYLLEIIVDHPDPRPWDVERITYRKAVATTDLSLYLQTGRAQTLAWLNHSVSGAALGGHRIEFAHTMRGAADIVTETDASGIATFKYLAEYGEIPQIIRIYDEEDALVYIDHTAVVNDQYEVETSDLYYSYLFLDRPLYQPTDEIQYWGYVRAYHTQGAPTPTEVEVIFDEGGLDVRERVPVGSDGSFYGSLDIEQVKSSQYSVRAVIPEPDPEEDEDDEESEDDAEGGSSGAYDPYGYDDYYDPYYYTGYGSGVLDSVWIDVKEYETPDVLLSTSTDKDFYLWDEEVTVTITPTFYDGTPLPNYELEFSVYNSYYGYPENRYSLTTDLNGVATVTFPAYQASGESTGWLPTYNRYEVRVASDGENVVLQDKYLYLPSDTILHASFLTLDNGEPVLQVQANAVNTQGLTAERLEQVAATDYYYSYFDVNEHGFLRGAGLDTQVEATVSLRYYPIGRSNSTTSQEEYTITTSGGTASLAELLPRDFNDELYAYIEVTLTTENGMGKAVTAYAYWYNSKYYGGQYDYGNERRELQYFGYSLGFSDTAGEDRLAEFQSYLTYNSATYGDGESMVLTLLYNDEPAPNEGRVLYTILQNEIIDQGTATSDSFTLRQNVDWANSVNIVAAYFDGTTVYPIRNTVVGFDTNSARIHLEVTTDKESYRPGDSMTVSVRATDQNGNGVAGPAVVSVVDESLFALKEQYVSVLSDLYGDLYFYNTTISKYTTSTGDLPYNHGVGDGGKGGDTLGFYDSYRKDFRDTAAFVPLRTNSSGAASTTFTLPDNTTSWRITTVSIGDNLYAGNSKTNVVSTLPMYIRPVVSSKYIEGDDVAMLIQAHGTLLDADTPITYSIRLTGDNYDEAQAVTNLAYNANQINFGKLPEGEYTLVASASYSGYRDTVELPIAVISSNLELVINRELDLSQGLDINAMRYPVVLSFYDRENAAFFQSISSLLTHYCFRADQRMARYIAKEALGDQLDSVPYFLTGEDNTVSGLQDYEGGISWYEGSVPDPILTARIALLAPEQFNRNTMAAYFRRQLDGSKDPVQDAIVYMGLAAIGEPVTNEIELRLQSDTLLLERVYLTAALAYAGEEERALALYNAEVAPLIARSLTGEGAYVRNAEPLIPRLDVYAVSTNRDSITAAAWIAASRLGLADADDFALFFAKGWRINTLFECMVYVKNYDKDLAPLSFSYTVNGQTRTLNLGARGHASVSFTKSELEGLSLSSVPESLTAMAYYIGEPGDVDFAVSENFSIEKSITATRPDFYRVDLTITFEDDAPLGYYDISEWVPSNMRLYGMGTLSDTGNTPRWWASCRAEGQKLYIQLNRRDRLCREVTISYTARLTFEGDAVLDSAYIIHGETGENNLSPRTLFEPD